MTEWRELVNEHDQAYQAFSETVSRLRPRQRRKSGVCGEWSVKDITAHFIHWELEAAARFKEFLNGPVADKAYDIDAINAQTVAAYEHLSWETVWQRLERAHQRLQQMAHELDSDQVITDERFQEWMEGRIEDFRLHTEQVRRKFKHG